MLVVGLLFLLLGGLAAQNTSPTSSADSTEGRKLGRVEGTVVNAVTNAPLARATVMLRSMGRPGPSSAPMVLAEGFNQMVPQDAPVSAATGADGKFVIENVPEGTYSAMAARSTFLVGYYGVQPNSISTITVAAGGSVKDIVIKLNPQGIITGRVTDADGEPMQGIMVQAARWVYLNGRKVLSPSGSGVSNDLGDYRIASLQPGKYFIVANQAMRMMGTGPAGNREAIPLTYYPNSLEATGAAQVPVEPGAEARGFDFRLRKAPAVMLSGTVDGVPSGGMVALSVVPVDDAAGVIARMGQRFTPVQNGKFAVGGILPGAYELRADYRPGRTGDQLFGRLRVDVGKDDLKDLAIALTPGAQVSGSFRIEGDDASSSAQAQTGSSAGRSSGAAPQTLSPSMLRVGMRSQEGMMASSVTPEKDLTFVLYNVAPGKYVPYLFPPPGFFIKSIKLDEHDGGDQYVDVLPQAQMKLEVVLARGGGEVNGTVEGADGKPAVHVTVSLHFSEPSARMDREKTARTDDKGAFKIQGVPPGTYRLFAWDGSGSQWRSEEFRKEHEASSKTVKLTETSKETVSLKPIPLPPDN